MRDDDMKSILTTALLLSIGLAGCPAVDGPTGIDEGNLPPGHGRDCSDALPCPANLECITLREGAGACMNTCESDDNCIGANTVVGQIRSICASINLETGEARDFDGTDGYCIPACLLERENIGEVQCSTFSTCQPIDAVTDDQDLIDRGLDICLAPADDVAL